MLGGRFFLTLITLGLWASFAFAQSVDETELNRYADEVASLQRQISDQTNRLRGADSQVAEARAAMRDAEYTLQSAQREARFALDRSLSSMSASEYLSGTRGSIEALRDRLREAAPEDQAALRAQIEALQAQLDEEAARYGGASNQRLAEIDRTSQAVDDAEAVLTAARETFEAESALRVSIRSQLERLQLALGQALENLAAESDKVAPAWVQEVRVTQDGELVYHASWAPDDSVRANIQALIDEHQRQRAEMVRIRGLIEADIAVYSREADAAYLEVRQLIDEQLYNDVAVIVGDRLWNFGQITLMFTTGAGVAKAGYTAAAATGSLTSRAALSAASRQATAAAASRVGFMGLPQYMSWPTYVTRATTALRLTSQAWSYQQALANTWRFTEATAAAVTTFQTVQRGRNLASGAYFDDPLRERYEDADFRRARGVLQRAVDRIESFPEDHHGFIMRHSMRQRYAQQSLDIMNRAYAEVQNQVLETESDFWHRIYIGYIWTSRAEISGALDQAALMYMRALQSGYGDLIGVAAEEIEAIDAAIAETDERLTELRAELAGPDVRKLSVHVNERLRIREDGTAEIHLVFSQPLTEAPRVKIGAGPLGTTDQGSEDSSGLPLPETGGAVLAEITGESREWSGPFPLTPLQIFLESETPLAIEISGRDAANRMFDANPRTGARRRPGNSNWAYNEPDFESSQLGSGGPDRWHELNALFEGGTSYVFVVDASGSMEENDRMAQVKRSARSFVANMTPRDEIAVIAFFDCYDIRLLQAFTREHQDVLSVVDSIEPASDTPLAAAIMRGGDFLIAHGHYDDKALIVLTDGAESCRGDPVAAAALFRQSVRVHQGLSGVPTDPPSPPLAEPTPEDEAADPAETEQSDADDIAEPQPADRDGWTVMTEGGRNLPTIVLVRTRYHEWQTGDSCVAQVTREYYYAYYGQAWQPDASAQRGFGVNRRPRETETLATAQCTDGQAAMDAFRTQWAQLDGTDYDTARSDAESRAMEALER